MNLPQNVPEPERTCPHLGLFHDPKSLMDYPCAQNICYHSDPPSTPGEPHQKKYCLEPAYKACPLYCEPLPKAMPKEIMDAAHKRRFYFNIFPWTLGLLFLVLTGVFYYNWPLIGPNLVVPSLVPTGEQPVIAAVIPVTGSEVTEESTMAFTPTELITLTPTYTVSPVFTSSPTDTLTVEPTLTDTPTRTPEPPRALQTPFGVDRQYLIHRILGGETLEWIAKNHGTSIEAIRAANYELPPTLWEDALVVVPFNQTDIDGIIPMTIYKVSGEAISIELLAEEQQVNLMILCQVNDRPHSYVFLSGEWVLIPHSENTTAW